MNKIVVTVLFPTASGLESRTIRVELDATVADVARTVDAQLPILGARVGHRAGSITSLGTLREAGVKSGSWIILESRCVVEQPAAVAPAPQLAGSPVHLRLLGAAAAAAMCVGLWAGGNWAVSLGPVAAPPAWKAAARARPQPAAPAPEPVFEPVADDTPRELAGPPEPTERDLLEQARAAEAAERWEEATDYYGKAWARAVEAKKEALEGIQRSAEAAGNTTTARDAAEHLAADSTRKEMR